MVKLRKPPPEVNPDLQELLNGVNSLPCSYSQKQMLRVLRGLAGRRLYITRRELVAPDQLALAMRLMNEMRMNEAASALMVRLHVGKSKAYKLITAALQARAGVVPATMPHAEGLRQLALVLDDEED